MTTQLKGKISTWKDDKGFGFIKPDNGGKDVFFHVSGLVNSRNRPSENIAVTYTLTYDEQQRPRAVNVQLSKRSLPPVVMFTIYVVIVFFIALAFLIYVFNISPLVPVVYIVISFLTFRTYSADKNFAMNGLPRIPEFILHLMELIGGWPGALVAQWHYRHKNRKMAYQISFWINVVINLGALIGYCVIAGYRPR